MDKNRLKEIMTDETFLKHLAELKTPAEMQMAFKQKGLELTEEEIMPLAKQINKCIESGVSPEELSLEQLGDISGGLQIGQNPILGGPNLIV